MKNGINISGGLQRIRQEAEAGTMALATSTTQIPNNAADYALSHTQSWTTEESQDAFIDGLNREFAGKYDFCFGKFGGETILEISGL
jgi:fructose-1,6-bisphosphatase